MTALTPWSFVGRIGGLINRLIGGVTGRLINSLISKITYTIQ